MPRVDDRRLTTGTTHVHVQYFDRGRLYHDEVLCRAHYDEMRDAGAFEVYLRDRYRHTLDITPWAHEPRCSRCQVDAIPVDQWHTSV